MKYRISANVIKRLPRYVRALDGLAAEETEKISSGELGNRLGLTASQIRQDFNCFGGFGHQGYGYNVSLLRRGIEDVLGVSETLSAVLIGAGNLGRAILANFNFAECGIALTAAFDADPAKIGRCVGGTEILDAATLTDYLQEQPADIAILTLPKTLAVETARLAVENGVRGIWNFTGTDIDPAVGAVIEDVHLSDSLLTLGYYLRNDPETVRRPPEPKKALAASKRSNL